MKNLQYLIIVFLLLVTFYEGKGTEGSSPSVPPSPNEKLAKRELRGVWLTTVWGLDWPNGIYTSEGQKASYVNYLNEFEKYNINAVFVQIRPMADAFYNSSYEPWSKYIANSTAADPSSPGYDVLQFMIEETHKKGMEFHAWMNPYRINTNPTAELSTKIDPNLTIVAPGMRIYNPALVAAQDRLVAIVKDVITKYEVDGIHFDDYFYPEGSKTSNFDDADYAALKVGNQTKAEFRRSNVDAVVLKVSDMIKAEKPAVRFSISPTLNQSYNYNNLFADVSKWCKRGWVDYIIPQFYVSTGHSSAPFATSLNNWLNSNYTAPGYKSTTMVGCALYKFGDPTYTATDSRFGVSGEMTAQFAITDSKGTAVEGAIFYSAKHMLPTPSNTALTAAQSELKTRFAQPAIPPAARRDNSAAPSKPTSVAISGSTLSWAATAPKFVVYRKSGKSWVVVAVTQSKLQTLSESGEYAVTSVSSRNKESELSVKVTYTK